MAEDILISEVSLVTRDGDRVSLTDLLVAAGVNLGNTDAGDFADLPDASERALGSLYFALDTGDTYRRNADVEWDLVITSGASGSPTGTAAGDLSGTYPAPTIADGAVTGAKVAAAIKDAAAATASLRTLGTTPTSAAAGNDSRLSNSRTPSGTAGGALTGSYPNPTLATPVYSQAEVNALVAGLATAQSVIDAIVAHLAAADPHTQYLLESAIGTSVASLSGGRVPVAQLGSGTATSTKVLAGDGSWQPLATLLEQTPGIITDNMLSADVAGIVTAQVAEHDESSDAHASQGFVALYANNATDDAYVPVAGRKILIRLSGDHDPTAETNDYDVVGDGTV